MKTIQILYLCFAITALPAGTSIAQTPDQFSNGKVVVRSDLELEELLEPIALYPDPLLAQLLPAATFPGEIVLASRYISSGGDMDSIDQQPWDSSVRALTRYPEVLRWLDENLSWTMAVGEAFLNQEQEVMNAIQRLRAKAQAQGSLVSTQEENVITDNGLIEILPSNSETLLVPEPRSVVIVIHSKTSSSRRLPYGIGPWLNHDCDWPNRRLIVWSAETPRPARWWSYSHSQRHCLGDVHPRVWRGHERRSHGGLRHSGSSQRSTTTAIGGNSGRSNARSASPSISGGAGCAQPSRPPTTASPAGGWRSSRNNRARRCSDRQN